MDTSTESPDRRRFLGRVITSMLAVMGGILGVILGGAVVTPGLAQREDTWLPAASLGELPENEPQAITVRVARQDGYREIVDRRTVFLVRSSSGDVTCLDSTCTHLGCRVEWDSPSQELRCPCHGGAYDRTGAVKSGPPPSPLTKMPTRIADGHVLVQL